MEQTREKRPERTQTSAQNEFNEFGNGMRTIWTTSADTNCREQYKEYKDKLRVVRMSMRNERTSVGTH